MEQKIVYQTLEDLNNPDVVENDGPFLCKKENAWLGRGFYFWDSFIDNAHWWGLNGAKYDNYIICKAECDFNTNECFDLVGEIKHIQEFIGYIDMLKKKRCINDNTTVSRIIAFIKDELKIFKYSAVRIVHSNSNNFQSKFNLNIPFDIKFRNYYRLPPLIQICFYTKKSMNLRNYKIVFPENYIDGYAV